MLVRLLAGILKGLVVGGLLGFGLAKLGMGAPIAFVAYLAAALTGVVVGLVAGKPIWAKDAKIEAGMKAFVGALLGAGLMWAVRSWLKIELPFALPDALGGANPSLGEAVGTHGTIGGLAITSLAAVAAVLGGFYDADNTPGDEGAAPPKRIAAAAAGKRIAGADGAPTAADEDDEVAAEKPRARK
jgi:hypothetical protein